MPVLIDVLANRSIGWAALRFPYHEKAKNTVKAIVGSRWIDPDKANGLFDDNISAMIRSTFDGAPKAWYVPIELIDQLKSNPEFKLREKWMDEPRLLDSPGIEELVAKLKPYQQEGFKRCYERDGYILTFEPRVGKTPTAIVNACALLGPRIVDLVLVLAPNNVMGEWERQLPQWAGTGIYRLAGFDPLLTMEVNKLRDTPFLFVGCHYEILSRREKCLARLIDGRRYAIIYDEIQMCANRKSGRYLTGLRLSLGKPIIAESDTPGEEIYASGTCVNRVGLTGTEMRNRPRNLYAPVNLVRPGYWGFYWNGFAKRFCDATEVAGRWYDKPTKAGNVTVCKGISHAPELKQRLALVSMKVTRAEAAPWLPKMDRKIIICQVPPEQLAKYKKLEQAYGKRIRAALEGTEPSAEDATMIAEMDKATSEAKIDRAIKDILSHLDRGVKVRISAHHHETVRQFEDRFLTWFDEDHELQQYPTFRAAGYDSQAARNEAIARWKAYSGAALLITNNLSSGVGIDLSDAKVHGCLEPEYVPADQQQWEDRGMDVHLGKVTEPPLILYWLVPKTLDELKIVAVLSKLRMIEEVTGPGTETGAMAKAFRDAGIVDPSRLGLADSSMSTAAAALRALRERLLRGPNSGDVSLEAEMASWEDDETESDLEDNE